jgi:gas vesicle protein
MSEFEKEKIKDIQEEITTQKVKLEQLKIEKANLIARTKEQHREAVSKINHDYAERMARVETLKLEAND